MKNKSCETCRHYHPDSCLSDGCKTKNLENWKSEKVCIGFYKIDFENFVIQVLLNYFLRNECGIIVYGNYCHDIKEFECYDNLDYFFSIVDFIVANRIDDDLKNWQGEIYTADLYRNN